MDDNTQKLIRQQEEMRTHLAHGQVASAIGQAVLALHAAGEEVSTAALIALLRHEAAHLQPDQMVWLRNAEAVRRLELPPGS